MTNFASGSPHGKASYNQAGHFRTSERYPCYALGYRTKLVSQYLYPNSSTQRGNLIMQMIKTGSVRWSAPTVAGAILLSFFSFSFELSPLL